MSLAEDAQAMLAGIQASDERPRNIGRLAAYDGLMLEATGFDRPVGSGARVITADGRAPDPTCERQPISPQGRP